MTAASGPPPLRVAFIGTGRMAGHHLLALRRVATPHVVVAVHDVDHGAGQAFARRAQARACRTLAELLEGAAPHLVHVCTPAGAHFRAARQALLAGAHVYVEKPLVETAQEAEALFALAGERGLLICAGHQLLRDPAFGRLLRAADGLGPAMLVDSHFAFRPATLDPERATPGALAEALLDVLPHPLYALVAALERLGCGQGAPAIAHVTASPTALHALLRAGETIGRLSVTLRARPVASTLTVSGTHGSVTADFVRATVHGAANQGTTPIEKVVNPFLEATQIAWRSAASLGHRLVRRSAYPGLAELLAEFYAAAAAGGPPPLSAAHLGRVTDCYEQLAVNVRHAATTSVAARAPAALIPDGRPVAALTGAAGFFGRAIAHELARRGFRVRGIGRSERPDDPHVHDWVRADLAADVPAAALEGAAVVVHAAAETAGGFEDHERNTVGATRRVLRAMTAARVRRLVYVSSISVLRPPGPFWERQSERTPRARRPERLGPYAWGKCAAEELVVAADAREEVEARIVRPAALVDWRRPEVPGLVGRRVFGRWVLGLGRPGLPVAVCDVRRAGAVVAWCADRFADAPPIVNLVDPAIRTRGQLLGSFRDHGWRGAVLWVPISLVAGAATTLGVLAALVLGEGRRPLSVWAILRPRRYDTAVAATVIHAADLQAAATGLPAQAPVRVARARG